MNDKIKTFVIDTSEVQINQQYPQELYMNLLKDQIKYSKNSQGIIIVPYQYVKEVGLLLSFNFEAILTTLQLITNKSRKDLLLLLNLKLESNRYFKVDSKQLLDIASQK